MFLLHELRASLAPQSFRNWSARAIKSSVWLVQIMAAASLTAVGADVQRGSLDDLESLRIGAAAADAVIHAGFNHDFSNYAVAAETDRLAIETIGSVLAGSERPFIVTSGTALGTPGRIATEEDAANSTFPRKSEKAAASAAARGVRVSVLRLPPSVHGDSDHGFVPLLIGYRSRKRRLGLYRGRLNHWPAVHRLDAARLYRLVLERAPGQPAITQSRTGAYRSVRSLR